VKYSNRSASTTLNAPARVWLTSYATALDHIHAVRIDAVDRYDPAVEASYRLAA
jgi:hypothetical protein